MKEKEIKMQVNEFFNTVGSNRNRQVVCADGFKMSVQAFAGGYCTPRTAHGLGRGTRQADANGVRVRACSSGN